MHVPAGKGAPADPPLSTAGREQARLMAASLAKQQLDRIYTSPLRRAAETAEPLAKLKSMTPEVEDGVAEYDRHADHYIPVEELKRLDYRRWRRLMRGELDGVDFPGFCKRVVQALDEIVKDNAGARVAVVCHGGVINVWAAHVMGFEPRMFFNPNYTSINRFMVAGSGQRSVITLNEHHHLM